MTEQTSEARRDTWVTVAIVVGAVLLFALFLLRPVKCYINQWPLLWRILYPALAVFAGVMVVQTVRAGERWFEAVRWGLLVVAGVTGSVTFYGGPGVYLQVAKGFAIAFVVAEVLDVILTAFSGDGAA
jgi:peptidoglycan/LPS O-acetylase OafA/YrhL